MDALRQSAVDASASARWFDGIPGLFLNIDRLSELGADNTFLSWWEHGRPLEAAPARPQQLLNHRSIEEHSAWAEREWARLESLGKVEFYPPGQPAPSDLTVNPCALLLKAHSC